MSKKVTVQHLSVWSRRRLVHPFQVGNDHRYGTCTTPGTAYFFQRTRIASGARKPPTHCSAFTVYGDLGGLISVTFLCSPQRIEDLDIPIWQDGSLFLGRDGDPKKTQKTLGDPWNQCIVGRLDSYFKVNAAIPGRKRWNRPRPTGMPWNAYAANCPFPVNLVHGLVWHKLLYDWIWNLWCKHVQTTNDILTETADINGSICTTPISNQHACYLRDANKSHQSQASLKP